MKENLLRTHSKDPAESLFDAGSVPLFIRQLSPEMRDLLDKHFWCDFSDIIPAMTWDGLSNRKN